MKHLFSDFYNYHFKTRQKALYIELAVECKRYGISAFRIYRLAHGRKVKSSVEVEVLHKLQERGVIAKII